MNRKGGQCHKPGFLFVEESRVIFDREKRLGLRGKVVKMRGGREGRALPD